MMQEGFGGRKNHEDKENIQQGLGARKSLQPDAAARVLRKKSSQRDGSRANFCRLCSRYYTLHCQDLEQSRGALAMLAYFPLCCPDPPWPTCKTHHQFKQTDRKTDRHRRTRTRRLAWYLFADRQKLLCKFCSS